VGPDDWIVELDDDGRPRTSASQHGETLLNVTRVTHSFALGELLGIPGCASLVDRGLRALERHHDGTLGGWWEIVGPEGPRDRTKTAYGHAHVLLAASTALMAGHDSRTVLDEVTTVLDERFVESDSGASRENFDHEWAERESYRGANSNMHLLEASLAAFDATGDDRHARRASGIAERLINQLARRNDWMLPEHYGAEWSEQRGYNYDRKDDPFRPYGVTIGHLLEWSRLLLSLNTLGRPGDEWTYEAATQLFRRAVDVGWDSARGGLAYTVDFDGGEANPDKYWWPVCEGIAAAAVFQQLSGEGYYEEWYRRLWEFAADHFMDAQRGGWYCELDSENRRKDGPWFGKPDVYHTLQSTVVPRFRLAASVAGSILAGEIPSN
jgi:mannose/cellobiose epimerase-like protein (N-acyl-D-glucosamine 2-epimerase family)